MSDKAKVGLIAIGAVALIAVAYFVWFYSGLGFTYKALAAGVPGGLGAVLLLAVGWGFLTKDRA